jgi:hypothetical protein
MFQWVRQPGDPLILKLPFKIYWATSGSITFFFVIGLFLISKPRMVMWFVDKIRSETVRTFLQDSDFYRTALDRVDREKAKIDSIKRRNTQQAVNAQQAENTERAENNGKPRKKAAQISNRVPVPLKGFSISEMEEGHASKLTF